MLSVVSSAFIGGRLRWLGSLPLLDMFGQDKNKNKGNLNNTQDRSARTEGSPDRSTARNNTEFNSPKVQNLKIRVDKWLV